MKAEMYRSRKNMDTRIIGGKPEETAFVDNDGIYDPDCENDGKFRAKQCNNTDQCWCVNSAGVRRTDKGDKDLKCEKLVETQWVVDPEDWVVGATTAPTYFRFLPALSGCSSPTKKGQPRLMPRSWKRKYSFQIVNIDAEGTLQW